MGAYYDGSGCSLGLKLGDGPHCGQGLDVLELALPR